MGRVRGGAVLTPQELAEALLGQADVMEQALNPGRLLRKPAESDPLLRVVVLNQVLLSRAMAEMLTFISADDDD